MNADNLTAGANISEAYREYVEEEAKKTKDRRAREQENQLQNLAIMAQNAQKAQREREEGAGKKSLAVSTMAPSSEAGGMMQRVDASRFLNKPLGRQVRSTQAPPTPPQAPPPQGLASGCKLRAGSRAASCSAPHCTKLLFQDHHLKARWFDGLTPKEVRAGLTVARQRAAASAVQRAEA